jgi:hypothetical protein
MRMTDLPDAGISNADPVVRFAGTGTDADWRH